MKRSKRRRKKRIFNIWIGGGIGTRKNEALERDGGSFEIAERRRRPKMIPTSKMVGFSSHHFWWGQEQKAVILKCKSKKV